MVSVVDRTADTDPWSALPGGLAPLLRTGTADLAGDVVREIRRSIPEYSETLRDGYGDKVRAGIESALKQFINQIADPTASKERYAEISRRLGQCAYAAGRSLDTLQAAYRIGARVAWRHLAHQGQRLALSVPTLCLLGEALFEHIDELAALAAEGYATAQAHAVGVLERRRRRLLEMLLADPPAPWESIARLAEASAWPMPQWVCAVVLEPRPDIAGPPPELSVPDIVLADLESAEPRLLVPCGERRGTGIRFTVRHGRAAVGPAVRLPDAARSLRWARQALGLVHRGVLPGDAIIDCSAHLSTLVLSADESLVTELAERALEPLAELTPKQRERLAETLLASFHTRGGAPEIASRLGVHPQTVRHRMRQLQALFDDRLDDPDARFELEIALRKHFRFPRTATERRSRSRGQSDDARGSRTASIAASASRPAATRSAVR